MQALGAVVTVAQQLPLESVGWSVSVVRLS